MCPRLEERGRGPSGAFYKKGTDPLPEPHLLTITSGLTISAHAFRGQNIQARAGSSLQNQSRPREPALRAETSIYRVGMGLLLCSVALSPWEGTHQTHDDKKAPRGEVGAERTVAETCGGSQSCAGALEGCPALQEDRGSRRFRNLNQRTCLVLCLGVHGALGQPGLCKGPSPTVGTPGSQGAHPGPGAGQLRRTLPRVTSCGWNHPLTGTLTCITVAQGAAGTVGTGLCQGPQHLGHLGCRALLLWSPQRRDR